jgi:formylglycine-generating enzyme required for sulfatase activity
MERKRSEEAKRREEERKRAEEAKRREEERKRAEQTKLALAASPKLQVPSTTQPAVGVYPSDQQPGDTFRDCPDCPEMVVVPAGSFTMGSPANTKSSAGDRGPSNKVTIPRAFAIGKYEVTYDEWQACRRAGGCRHWMSNTGRKPVQGVGWHDAKEYVGWLSQNTAQNYRLPSESEWEYAARRANALGLQGVDGNGWEWVEDCWNNDHSVTPADGSAWTTSECSSRVQRGNPWNYRPGHVRSGYRNRFDGGFRRSAAGFRIARTLL